MSNEGEVRLVPGDPGPDGFKHLVPAGPEPQENRQERVAGIPVHPAATLFPRMGEAALTALADDIQARGIREPIAFLGDELVDGRDRVAAASKLGMNLSDLPRVTLPENTDPWAYAWSVNAERKSLTAAHKAELHIKLLEVSGRYQREREEVQRVKAEKCAAAATVQHGGSVSPETHPQPKSDTLGKLAKEAGVSRATYARVKAKRAGTSKRTKPPTQPLGKLVRDRRSGAVADWFVQRWPPEDCKALVNTILERLAEKEAAEHDGAPATPAA